MPDIFLKNLEAFRRIEWARSWTWDIQFEDKSIPGPFNQWFPATEVEEGLYNLEAYPVPGVIGTYEIPKSWVMLSLSITFIDSAYLDLENWLVNWVNTTIFGGGRYVAPLNECLKKVNILKLTGKKEIVSASSYLVFPTGPLSYSGNSTADVITHQVEFRIAKVLSRETFQRQI